MKMKKTCPKCGEKMERRGKRLLCPSCGYTEPEKELVRSGERKDEAEKREKQYEKKPEVVKTLRTVVGTKGGKDGKGKKLSPSQERKWNRIAKLQNQYTKKERKVGRIWKGLIERIGSPLELPPKVRSRAHEIYRIAREQGATSGLVSEVTAGATLWHAAREQGIQLDRKEIEETIEPELGGIEDIEIKDAIRKIRREIPGELRDRKKPLAAKIFRDLELSPRVRRKVWKDVEKFSGKGKKHKTLLAGAIYHHAQDFTQGDLAEALDVSVNAISRAHRELY